MMQFVSFVFFIAILSESIIANPVPQNDWEISLPNEIRPIDVLDGQTVPAIDPDSSNKISDSTCKTDLQPDQIVQRGTEDFCQMD